MAFTVQDALKTGKLREAQLRAGAQGVTRTIASVNVMEVPDILAWVKPHELLLTTLYPLRDVPGSLAAFITELARRDLAGLIVKTGRYVETLPEEMCQVADDVGLPLIELRSEVSFDDIITELLSGILRTQTQRLQHSEEVHRRFTAIVLDGGGLQHIAENLAQLTSNPVVIVTPDRRVLALSTLTADAHEVLNPSIRVEMGSRYLDLEVVTGQARGDSTVVAVRKSLCVGSHFVPCFACPIRVGTQGYGWIIVVDVGLRFSDDDAVAMEHAATVSALAIMKDQAILAVERKFQSDFLDDLLAGRIPSMEVVLTRSQTLGLNLTRPCVVCIAEERKQIEGAAARWSPVYLRNDVGSMLLEHARSVARRIDADAIVVEKSGQLIFIVGVSTPEKAANVMQKRDVQGDIEMGQQLLRDMRFLQREREFVLGIGRRCGDALQLARSYQEARQAIAIGGQLQDMGAVIHFNDLGFQRILSQFEKRVELYAFADELLGTLEVYDRRHHTDLVHTLDAVLQSNLNMVVAARILHLHYNSLRYRLQKIEEVTGPFMDDARQRLSLELALYIRKMGRD